MDCDVVAGLKAFGQAALNQGQTVRRFDNGRKREELLDKHDIALGEHDGWHELILDPQA